MGPKLVFMDFREGSAQNELNRNQFWTQRSFGSFGEGMRGARHAWRTFGARLILYVNMAAQRNAKEPGRIVVVVVVFKNKQKNSYGPHACILPRFCPYS